MYTSSLYPENAKPFQAFRYYLKTPNGFAVATRNGTILGYSNTKQYAGAFTRSQLEPFRDKIEQGLYDAIACDGSDKQPSFI